MSGGIKNVFELDNEFGASANIIYMKWGGERGGYIKHENIVTLFKVTELGHQMPSGSENSFAHGFQCGDHQRPK